MGAEMEASAKRRVTAMANGDVRLEWQQPDGITECRQFRQHFGHVVEVRADGKVRRVGPALTYRGPALLVDGPLSDVISRALSPVAEAMPDARLPESATTPSARSLAGGPSRADMPPGAWQSASAARPAA